MNLLFLYSRRTEEMKENTRKGENRKSLEIKDS